MNCPKCGAKCESDQSFCVVCGAPLYSNGDNETVNNIDLNNDDLSATRIVSGISPDLNATKTNIDLHKKDVMETPINRKPIDFEENTFEENSQMLKDLLPVCVYTYFHFFHNDYKHDTRIQPALEKH